MSKIKHDIPPSAYELEIVLIGVKPKVWRRFLVSGDVTFDRLHDVIQILMGWQDYHCHEFEVGGKRLTEKPEQSCEGEEESRFRLHDFATKIGDSIHYLYDFGDSWHHTLTVRKITPVPTGYMARWACIGGGGACPPEDVGGIVGYQRFKKAMKDPTDPEHDEYRNWTPKGRQRFELEWINTEMAKFLRWSRSRELTLDQN